MSERTGVMDGEDAVPTPSHALKTYPCEQCGAMLLFKPGASELSCGYCGHVTPVRDGGHSSVEEVDLMTSFSRMMVTKDERKATTVQCDGCNANFTLGPNEQATDCPFCGTPVVVAKARTEAWLAPQGVLPFKIEGAKADGLYKEWISKLWFAPSALKYKAMREGKITGIYVPYWTFDAFTSTIYRGKRGTKVTRKVKDSDGKTQTEEEIVWRNVSGRVEVEFDDILVLASKSLPHAKTEALEPWDLENLKPFSEDYMAGFRLERFQVDLKEGWDTAKDKMEWAIRGAIERDIGGDEQEIDYMDTAYGGTTFKHVLLPVWLAAYRFNNKVYRFVVNARTGEVQGERPWSWSKIAAAVTLLIALIIGGYYGYTLLAGGG